MGKGIYRMGLDIGSTTAKIVLAGEDEKIFYSTYRRHNADIKGVVKFCLTEIKKDYGNMNIRIVLSGSAGMGVAERYSLPFIQEVIALNNFAKSIDDNLHTIIDIGGEDAKIIFLEKDALPDMRMNGNCAGGTGAFIDQMSVILGMTIAQMDSAAMKSDRLYPIASRCGVFSKTDIQNLIAKNVAKEDICASIFHAIAVQVVSSLSRGKDIKEKILLAGGPLTFIQSLKKAFLDYLHMDDSALVKAPDSNLLVARGCIYDSKANKGGDGEEGDYTILSIDEILNRLDSHNVDMDEENKMLKKNSMPQIFSSNIEYERWKREKELLGDNSRSMEGYNGKAYLGIDSGSTTTKIVLMAEDEKILFEYYAKNAANPIGAVTNGLKILKEEIAKYDCNIDIMSGCSTGYGEDLIKAAFSLDFSIVETIAHYTAAKKILPNVDFILDIGGQDMKAVYVEDGLLNRIELNEACSSGCGTFIETFANTLGYSTEEFANKALFAKYPCDLGTRCTVFMNSKVKQFLREGASVDDISAGLSYSVVRNCLFKVLKIEGKSVGDHIVVQGGTMKNDSIVRALEIMLEKKVFRSTHPELMGAYGCALYSKKEKNML